MTLIDGNIIEYSTLVLRQCTSPASSHAWYNMLLSSLGSNSTVLLQHKDASTV